MTRTELETAAFAEYQAHVHKVVLVKYIHGFHDEDSVYGTSRHTDGRIQSGDVVGVFANAWWRRSKAKLLNWLKG